MEKGKVLIYSGDGHGKSPAAIGRAVQAAASGQQVVIIQFLKERGLEDSEFLGRLEPEIKFFRFEKSEENFSQLPESVQQDEIRNIRNGLNYAKKVLTTGECNLLILDEVLGLIEKEIIAVDDLRSLIECKSDETTMILTGIVLNDDVCVLADEVSRIETVQFRKFD